MFFGLFLLLSLNIFASTQAHDIKIVTGVDQLYFNETKDQIIDANQDNLVNQVFASLNLIAPSEKINSLKFKDNDENGNYFRRQSNSLNSLIFA